MQRQKGGGGGGGGMQKHFKIGEFSFDEGGTVYANVSTHAHKHTHILAYSGVSLWSVSLKIMS
jgi:hypothetical protein